MILKITLRALKPFRLVSLVTTYLLGAGLVQYVREMRNWTAFFEGLAFLLLITLSIELFRLLQQMKDNRNWPEAFSVTSCQHFRWVTSIIAATLLTVGTTIVLSWILRGLFYQRLFFLTFVLIILSFLYYQTVRNEVLRTIQILIETFIFVALPPAIAYVLQSEDVHQLLTLVVIGLVPAYFANRILVQLKLYGSYQKYEINTFVTQLGWEKAMVFHNALVLTTYLLFALTSLVGFPWFLLWPVFLSLPIGLLEIWLMERVRMGGKPLWRVMRFATGCVFLIPVYLLAFAFWIR